MGADGPVYRWEFEKRGKPVTVSVSGPVIVNDVELMIRAALDGVGLAFALEEHVAEHIARGDLVRVLEDWCPPFAGFFLYYPSRRHQPRGPSGAGRRAPGLAGPGGVAPTRRNRVQPEGVTMKNPALVAGAIGLAANC